MTQGTTKGVPIDTDGTMSLNSNQVVPSQAAVVTYVGTQIGTKVTSVSGTTNRITSTGGATPVVDISASYVGQSSITTLGTIATGVWNGTDIALADGGTNASLTASDGGIFYSTATAGAILAGTATANKVLMSGASTTPSWSTPTYPAAAGTSGNVLTSDGTNWTSAAPAAGSAILQVTGTLTNSQIKALHATPITLIAAPGAGKVIVILQATAVMNYGGTNIFTDGGSAGVILSYSNTTNTAAATFMPTGQLVAASSRMNVASGAISSSLYSSNTNLAVVAYNSSVTEISGNAANNNTISYSILYTTMTP